MSDLTFIEKQKLEQRPGMAGGYVLDFTNQTFQEFFVDCVGIDIYDDKYAGSGDSKANRMRTLWRMEPNHIVAKVLNALPEYTGEPSPFGSGLGHHQQCKRITDRLSEGAPVFDVSAFATDTSDKTFDALAQAVKSSIDANEPEAGLDRLHTFTTKYLRALCVRHGIEVPKDKPLHSLLGEYIKALKQAGHLESEMTERILKTSISVLDAFNQVRNDQSLAHDNSILNYDESLLIFNNVASSIRFIQALERKIAQRATATEAEFDDDIPF